MSGGTYTYSTPDGQAWTFNSSGYMTKWTSADGNETLDYRYDGSNRLSGITAIDGALTTVTYTGSSSVAFQTVNSRTTTLTLSSGNLTKVTNPDGGLHSLTYDGSKRLTQELNGPNLENNWAYTSAGTLGTMTWGATSVGGVTNLSRTVVDPLVARGLSTLVSGTVFATSTNPTGNVTRIEFDSRGRPLQVSLPDGARSKLEYTSGFVTKVTDPLNQVTTLTRDGSGYATKLELPDGSLLTLQYQTAFHALTTIVNERGYTTTSAYDSSGRLTRMTNALGHAVQLAYTSGGLLEKTTDPLGNVTTSLYDSNRRLTGSIDALSRRTTTTYDNNGNVATTVDALNRTTSYAHDSLGRRTVTTNALGHAFTSVYDSAGFVMTMTDPLSKQTSTVYDRFKRGLASEDKELASGLSIGSLSTFDDVGRTISTRDAVGWSADTNYDPTGRATKMTNALGATSKTVFDLGGQAPYIRDTMGRWTRSEFDTRGRVTKTTNALGNVTTTAYDRAGNVTVRTDALGRTVTTTFDELNRATGTLDALLRRTTTTYDGVNNVLTWSDHLGRVTSSAYDALNRETKMTMAVGTGVQVTRETGYDEVGNVKTSKDGLGNVTTSVYDSLNRQTETINPLGYRTTTTFDAAGNTKSVKDALGKLITLTHDGLHRQIAVTDPLSHTATTVLDALGRTAGSQDALGNVQMTGYDAQGTPGLLDARGGYTFETTTPSGEDRLRIDPVGNEWVYQVDGLGRETVHFDPAGKATTTTYDAIGRISTVTDRMNRQTLSGYDNGDRVTSVVWKSAAGATVNLLTHTYDDNDNRLTSADYNGTVTYTFDERNRVKSYANVFGQYLTYTMDAADRVTKREDSLGGVLTSVYDNHDRLTSRRFTGTGSTGTAVRIDFGYSNRDEQSSITWYSDIAGSSVISTSTYLRDDVGRLTSIVNKDSAGVTLSYYNYTHDNANRVSSHSWWSQVGTVTYSGTNTYTYDTTNQLLTDSSATYSYDLNGNRTMAGYQTSTANRLTNDGTFTYTYDDSGNMIGKSKGVAQETWYYDYDNANRLTNIRKTSDGSTNLLLLTYAYDVEGKRVKEQEWVSGGSTTEIRLAIDGIHTWADLDSGNAAIVRRNHGNTIDQVLTRTVASGANAGLWIYTTDRLGSVCDLVNSSAQVKDHLDYTGFGVLTESHSSIGDRYTYTGRELNKNSELQDNRARPFNALLGRFTGEDPILFRAGDANLYRYVANNPVNATDPSGLDRYIIGGRADGFPTNHSRIAVDLWKKDKDGMWVHDGIVTYELGSDGGSSSGNFIGFERPVERLWGFWVAVTGLGVTGNAITKTNGLHLENDWVPWKKPYITITSTPEQDIKLYERLEADLKWIHLYHPWFNNCHLWVHRRQDIGIE